jgi:hypothetical protein
MIIVPTIGRIVWFWDLARDIHDPYAQPEAAIVTYVHHDHMVNLSVFSPNGENRARTSVLLCHEGSARPDNGGFCEWMPYQVGQAKKHAAEVPAELPNFREEGKNGV